MDWSVSGDRSEAFGILTWDYGYRVSRLVYTQWIHLSGDNWPVRDDAVGVALCVLVCREHEKNQGVIGWPACAPGSHSGAQRNRNWSGDLPGTCRSRE